MKKLFIITFTLAIFFTQNAFSKEFTLHKLSNGQTLIIKEIHDNPIVTIDTWIKTGSIDETDANNGVAHFLEHMFFKGTTKYPTGQFDRILESKGAITNAATSKDYTHYYIITPSKDFETALELHADMLLNPLLPRNELEMERKVVLEEMARGNDSPDSVLYKKMNALLYSEHPYKRDVIGLAEVIETIPREKMLEFYNSHYNPNNMITVIVGDVNTNNIIKLIEENFKTTNQPKAKKEKYKTEKIKTNIKPSLTNMDTQTGYLLIGFRGVKPNNKKDSAALDVLATILGNGKSSKLYKNLQEEKHLTTAVYSVHSSYKDDSQFLIKALFNPNNQSDVENEIWRELKNISKNYVSENELEKAKNIIKHDTYYSRESSSNIAEELGYITVLYNKPSYYNDYLKQVEKVNIKDINRVANKYIAKDKAAISYILPKGMEIKTIQKDKKVDSNITTQTSVKITPKVYADSTAKLISQSGNTKKYELNNGLILIITKNDNNDIISINMLSRGGYFQEDTIKKGTGNLLSDLLLKGTKDYTSSEINNFLEEHGIEISTKIQPDTFSTSIKTTKDELNNALYLFDDVINNSLLDDNDLKNAINKRIQDIKTSRDVPSNLAFDEMKHLLWENTPYQNNSKLLEKTYQTVTVNDIKVLYSQIYAPNNTIISINGDVDEQYLINYFSDVFKNKLSKTYKLSDYQNKIYPMVKDKSSVIEKNSNQAWIIMAYRTPALTNLKDRATLKVIDSILGTGMSSRLFSTLRDKQGLAYTVASIYQSNVLQGVFLTYIGTNPNTIEQAKKGMEEQITLLKRNFVSSKEIEQAKDRIKGNYILSQETNAEKAHTLSTFELQGLGYDFEKEYFKYIDAVTEQDIIETANKYFNAPKVTIIVK